MLIAITRLVSPSIIHCELTHLERQRSILSWRASSTPHEARLARLPQQRLPVELTCQTCIC
jgi:hypothetical protein